MNAYSQRHHPKYWLTKNQSGRLEIGTKGDEADFDRTWTTWPTPSYRIARAIMSALRCLSSSCLCIMTLLFIPQSGGRLMAVLSYAEPHVLSSSRQNVMLMTWSRYFGEVLLTIEPAAGLLEYRNIAQQSKAICLRHRRLGRPTCVTQ